MPFIVPKRGFTSYDNLGNFQGYFPSGHIPQCHTFVQVNTDCPVGSIMYQDGIPYSCNHTRKRLCPKGTPTIGFQRIRRLNSPWCSCNMYRRNL